MQATTELIVVKSDTVDRTGRGSMFVYLLHDALRGVYGIFWLDLGLGNLDLEFCIEAETSRETKHSFGWIGFHNHKIL